MTVNLLEASKAALSLSVKERAALAHTLITSLDEKVDTEIEVAWDKEIEARIQRIESGQTTERDAFEVLDEIRAKHGDTR